MTALPPGASVPPRSSTTPVSSSPAKPSEEGRKSTTTAASHAVTNITKSTPSTTTTKAENKRNILVRIGAAIGRAVQEGFAKLVAWVKGLTKKSADISANKTPVTPVVTAGGLGTSRLSVTKEQIDNAQAGLPKTKAALENLQQGEPVENLKIQGFKLGESIKTEQGVYLRLEQIKENFEMIDQNRTLQKGDQIIFWTGYVGVYAIVEFEKNGEVYFKVQDQSRISQSVKKNKVYIPKKEGFTAPKPPAEPGHQPLKIPNFNLGQKHPDDLYKYLECNVTAQKVLESGDQIVVHVGGGIRRYAIFQGLNPDGQATFVDSKHASAPIRSIGMEHVFVLREPPARPAAQPAAAPIASTPRTTFSLGDTLTKDEFEQYERVNNKALLQRGVDVVIREFRGPIYGKVLGENVHGFDNFVIKVGDRNIYADISQIYIKKPSVAQEANKLQGSAPNAPVQQKPSDRPSPKLRTTVNSDQVDTLTEGDIKNLKKGDLVIVERWNRYTNEKHYMYGQLAQIEGNVCKVRFKEDSRGHHFGQGVLRKLKDPSSPSAQKVEEPPVASARPQPAAKAPPAPKAILPPSPSPSSPRESFNLGDFLTKQELELWKKNSDENAPLNIGDEVVVSLRGGIGSYDKIQGYGVHKDGTPNKELILLEKNNLASKGVVYKKKAASAAAPAAEPSTAKPKGTGFKVGDEVIVEGLGFVKIRKIEGNKYYIRTDNDIVVNAYTAEQLKKPKG